MTVTCATPPVESSRGRMVQSARVRSEPSEVVSAVRPMNMTSPMMLDCGPRVGCPTPSGRASPMVANFSDTIWRSRYTSVPQSNSTHTTEKPVVDDERTRRTSVAPLRAVSIGKVTRRSTSSAAMPLPSVITTTVGALRSGNTSTSIFHAVQQPAMMSSKLKNSMTGRLRSEKAIILLSIVISRDL